MRSFHRCREQTCAAKGAGRGETEWECGLVEATIIYGIDKQQVLRCSAAAAAAKSLQSWPTLCNPIDGSPPGSPVPGTLQARTLEWVAIAFSNA